MILNNLIEKIAVIDFNIKGIFLFKAKEAVEPLYLVVLVCY